MAKVKKAFFCRNCGFEAPKWLGRCPSCGEWNTFTEEVIARESGGGPATVANLPKARPQRIADIHESEHRRIDLGNREVNRVLGGGLVPGSLVLLGGEPGIGKSTLSLQIALADNGLKTLYVSGEESAEQIKMRALRLGIGNEGCLIYAETLLENILAQIEEQRPTWWSSTLSKPSIPTSSNRRPGAFRRSANARHRCSNTPKRPERRSSSSVTSPRTARSPARKSWSTSSMLYSSSKGITT